jgi:hypothetical protein
LNSESKLKHLEFIQSVINRMAGNSFLLKGWSVTLVSALFVLAAKDSNKKYIVVAYFPVLVFWILDAYFLSQERLFRNLYDGVRRKTENDVDFSMDTQPFADSRTRWRVALFSKTLFVFYFSIILIMIFIMRFVNE